MISSGSFLLVPSFSLVTVKMKMMFISMIRCSRITSHSTSLLHLLNGNTFTLHFNELGLILVLIYLLLFVLHLTLVISVMLGSENDLLIHAQRADQLFSLRLV